MTRSLPLTLRAAAVAAARASSSDPAAACAVLTAPAPAGLPPGALYALVEATCMEGHAGCAHSEGAMCHAVMWMAGSRCPVPRCVEMD